MPILNLAAVEPFSETWSAMIFPRDSGKRRAYVARVRRGFYPRAYDGGLRPLSEEELVGWMKDENATPVDCGEIDDRRKKGLLAGDLLKVLFAIAADDPKRATWNTAARLLEHVTGASRALIYQARRDFLPAIHLWAAWQLRDRQIHSDASAAYSAADDVEVFLAEAMAMLQWATTFSPERAKARTVLRRDECDFWTPPPQWNPPIAAANWPRDGRLGAVGLPADLRQRIHKRIPAKNLSKSQ